MTEDDKKAIEAIRRILDKGNSAEVKKTTDGKIKVYEVRKNIVRLGN
jgi:predicted RNA binding protein with dsRBD fold (UPF0201 family)